MHALVEHDGADDAVAVEEPLEIRVDGAPVAVTMRTPGHDDELALHQRGVDRRGHAHRPRDEALQHTRCVLNSCSLRFARARARER